MGVIWSRINSRSHARFFRIKNNLKSKYDLKLDEIRDYWFHNYFAVAVVVETFDTVSLSIFLTFQILMSIRVDLDLIVLP